MITFAIERFVDVYAEMYPLLEQHYDEISTHKANGIPLAPQADEYTRREQAGQLVMVIGREHGKIAAYLVAFIGPGLHYRTCLTCIVDIFFVEETKRGAMHGKEMFEFTKNECRRRGVRRVAAGSKLAHDSGPLLRFVGMEPVETIHEMWL